MELVFLLVMASAGNTLLFCNHMPVFVTNTVVHFTATEYITQIISLFDMNRG